MSPGAVPWEDPEVPFPANLGLAWWDSLTRPHTFYRRVDWSGPLSRPVLYWLLVWIAAGMVSLLWTPAEFEAAAAALLGENSAIGGEGLRLLSFFLTPFAALLTLAAGAVVHHALAVALAPAHRSIHATTRVVSYAAAPVLLLAVPVPGVLGMPWTLACWAWTAALLAAGFREAHEVSTPRALAIALLPAATLALLVVVALFVLAALLAALRELPI